MRKELPTPQYYTVDLNIHFLQRQMKHPNLRLTGNGGIFQKPLAMQGDRLPVIKRCQPNMIDFMQWGWKPEFYVNSPLYNRQPLLYIKGEALNTYYQPYMLQPQQHRCIVIANSFFAWHFKEHERAPDRKRGKWVKHEFRSPKNIFLLFAGLYGLNANEKQNRLHFSIVSKPAIPSLLHYMKRMPLILEGNDLSIWLTGSIDDCLGLVEYVEPPNFIISHMDFLLGDDEYYKRETFEQFYHTEREDWNDLDEKKLKREKFKH